MSKHYLSTGPTCSLSELEAVTMAANMTLDTVQEQQQALRALESGMAEASRAMVRATNRIRRLESALAGEIGLVQLLASCDPKPAEILDNHRHIEALAALENT